MAAARRIYWRREQRLREVTWRSAGVGTFVTRVVPSRRRAFVVAEEEDAVDRDRTAEPAAELVAAVVRSRLVTRREGISGCPARRHGEVD